MHSNWEGKTVLLTGVFGFLGTALKTEFLNRGARVGGLDLVDEEGERPDRFYYSRCDLRDTDSIQAAITGFKEEGLDAFDVVINNAGLIFNSPMLKFEDGAFVAHDFDDWQKVIDVNLSAAFYVSACCVEEMVRKGKKGVIVNVSSICAGGNLGQPAYSASKAGLDGLTVSLAKELGPLGIRVAGVSPGYINTPSTRDNVDENWLAGLRKRTPLRRLVSVESFVGAVCYVIESPDFTGKILDIDAGLTL